MDSEKHISSEVFEALSHSETSPLSYQVRFTRFTQCYNKLLIKPTIEHYHQMRQEGLELIDSPGASPTIQNTARAMLRHLDWYAELCGDREAGERTEPNGYPPNHVYVGDARELMQYVPDQSVDLIFTDPPYLKEHMHLYGWLAQEAERVLTPDGFLLAYVGTYWKDDAMAQMREYLEYFWDYAIVHGGDLALQRNRMTRAGAKSILCYRKYGSDAMPQIEVQGVYEGTGADKAYHRWGQPVDEAAYYISCFSNDGSLTLDPFIGGGTTAVACAASNRDWIGFEIDEAFAESAQQRVHYL